MPSAKLIESRSSRDVGRYGRWNEKKSRARPGKANRLATVFGCTEVRKATPPALPALRRPQEQSFVQTAGPVPLQVEAHEPVADRLELANDRRRRVLVECARHLGSGELDARDVVVMTN